MKYEYRIAIAKGPLSAEQLNMGFGVDGWELVDVVQWQFDGEARLWHYFKRFKTIADVVKLESLFDRSTDKGEGSDVISTIKGGN